MSQTRHEIKETIDSYLLDEEKFDKGNDAAGKRARASLLKLAKLGKPRRLEIQAKRNERK